MLLVERNLALDFAISFFFLYSITIAQIHSIDSSARLGSNDLEKCKRLL
ncbi:hypothetical protein HMPREF1882_00279 [Streptococcus agalactiae]|nr:hypothetical protein HMPREF1882_00279 [Streptococcus agalactiae]